MTELYMRNGVPGVWVLYDYDGGPYAISIHAMPIETVDAIARLGYGHPAFWPIGMGLREAIELYARELNEASGG